MNKWFLIIDVAKCCNCQNCTMAMKDEYVGNDFPGYAAAQPQSGHEWITIDRHIRGSGSMIDVNYVPRTCNHCDNAPCIKAGAGTVYKRDDGIVIIDPVKAKGRKDIVSSCPYGVIFWNEEKQLPQQWIFDAHLLDQGWKEPRCTQACPTGALRALKTTDEAMASMVAKDGLAVLKPKAETKPRVYYRNLERITTLLVAGNIVARDRNGVINNVEGATVLLSDERKVQMQNATTDIYGDFRFNDVPKGVDTFTLHVSHPGYAELTRTVNLADAANLGSMELASA